MKRVPRGGAFEFPADLKIRWAFEAGLPDPATEARIPLHRGSRFILDTQRLWHVVSHPANAPRYALISSFESGPALDRYIASQLP